MKRTILLCGVTVTLILGCVSSDYPTGRRLLQPGSGCTYTRSGDSRFQIEALGGRWASFAKPGWDSVPDLEDIALVGAADIARRYKGAYFEILENERTHVWQIGLILGYRRRALHRLVIELTDDPEDEDAREILEALSNEVGYSPP